MNGNHDRGHPGSDGEDAALARAWQQASDEQPPPRLDAAIIAAARKSVQEADAGLEVIHASPRPRTRWLQWQPLAAAATVAGLAFMLVQLLPRERDVASPVRMEEPAPGPAASQERLSSPPARQATDAPPVTGGAGGSLSKAREEEVARSPSLDSTAGMRAREAVERKAVVSEPAREAASSEVAAPAMAQAPDQVAPPNTAHRAAEIVALYESGDAAGAAEALRAFRAADPAADEYLPDSLRDWARTVE